MHIPDGFLDARTAVVTGALAAGGLGLALRRARTCLPSRRVPLLGLSAAFVFAAQMINFPVLAGTSGHLVGAVLTAVLLGPSAAVVVISAVLIVQCFMFADGGVSALGANILNMALIGGVGGWVVYRLVRRLARGLFGQILAAFFAAWCGVVLSAMACAGELAASGTVGWRAAWTAMTGVHMLIGVGEGLITGLVLAGIARVRPELLAADPAEAAPASYGAVAGYGVLISLALALFVSPLASSWPDGFERAAEALGFAEKAADPLAPAPIPDYAMPGIPWGWAATSIAGAIGTAAVFGLAWLTARLLASRCGAREPCTPPGPAQETAGR